MGYCNRSHEYVKSLFLFWFCLRRWYVSGVVLAHDRHDSADRYADIEVVERNPWALRVAEGHMVADTSLLTYHASHHQVVHCEPMRGRV